MTSTCATGTGCGAPGTDIASYAYTLGAAGNRLSVAELGGRTVNFVYDNIYRLTSEAITGGPSQNGVISYQYDPAGNRLQRNSTVPAVPATGLLNYDANDRTSTDPYDNNGNLLNAGGGSNLYDFENHLVRSGGVDIVYDGDGNRVEVVGLWWEDGFAPRRAEGFVDAMRDALGAYLRFVGVDHFEWSPQLAAQKRLFAA